LAPQRHVPEGEDLFVIGELVGASGFGSIGRCMMAKWSLVYGDAWGVVQGEVQGATQAATPMARRGIGLPSRLTSVSLRCL
jgi:hypothetical protein